MSLKSTTVLLDLTRAFLAAHFEDPGGYTLRWWRGEFYRWDGSHYLPRAYDDIRQIARHWLFTTGHGNTLRDAEQLLGGIEMVCALDSATEPPVFCGPAKSPTGVPLVVANGLLDLEALLAHQTDPDVILQPHTPRWFCLNALPYPYDPDARCPRWLQFLDEVFKGDPESAALLQEWFGYCLTHDTSLQTFMCLIGPPRSGKGVTCRVLQALVGPSNCAAFRLSTLGGPFGLWGFLNKTVAICADAHLSDKHEAAGMVGAFKSIIGEDDQEIHRKNLPVVHTHLRVRLMLAINEIPKLSDNCRALFSRMRLLHYPASFVDHEDRNLNAALCAESPGIFLWAIEGLRRLRATGVFTQPAASVEHLELFAAATSVIQCFREEELAEGPDNRVPCANVYPVWQEWCDKNGHYRGTPEHLGTQLAACGIPGFHRARLRIPGGRQFVYTGFRLRRPPGPNLDQVLAQTALKTVNGHNDPNGPSDSLSSTK